MLISLVELKAGQSGRIVNFQGGQGLQNRATTMGIRPGKLVTKVSSHFWRGPQTVKIDNFQVSIGYGMALKIMIEVEE